MFSVNQTFVLAIVVATFIIILFVFFSILVVLNNIKQRRHFILETKNRESAFRQELLHAQLEMQEHTFRTVGQEIHDNVGQILSLAKLNLNILASDQQSPPQIHDIKEQVNQAITELRNLSNGYYGEKLAEMGLQTAIRNQVVHLEKTGLFTTWFRSEIDHITVEKNKTIFLFRIVQESLSNIVKHANADHVSVELTGNQELIQILIQDNGCGFSVNSDDFVPGIGLSSIRHRASVIQAVIDIRSAVNKGTTIRLTCRP